MVFGTERCNNATHYGHKKYPFQFPFERDYENIDGCSWMQQNWHTVYYYLAAYLALIYLGQLYMKSRPSFQLRWTLFIWDASLAIFSIIGTIRTLPELYFTLSVHNFYHSICVPTLLECNVTAFWVFVFTLSKVLELGDTFFMVLRKQKLTFLHVYHHATVLVISWYLFKEQVGFGRWFVYMNFSIHSVMYSYYALKAARVRIPRQISMVITSSQVLQMIFGCFVTGFTIHARIRGQNCRHTKGSVIFTFLLYLTYLFLFLRFFVTVYIYPKGKIQKKSA